MIPSHTPDRKRSTIKTTADFENAIPSQHPAIGSEALRRDHLGPIILSGIDEVSAPRAKPSKGDEATQETSSLLNVTPIGESDEVNFGIDGEPQDPIIYEQMPAIAADVTARYCIYLHFPNNSVNLLIFGDWRAAITT
uniref:Uncharacterized protein n=1 Tax=Photinus pyralis TaxID=7054 RepID=A0A1Y1LPT9_PHOPY